MKILQPALLTAALCLGSAAFGQPGGGHARPANRPASLVEGGECPVCGEIPGREIPIPIRGNTLVTTPCGHRLCRACIAYNVSGSYDENYANFCKRCPVCRRDISSVAQSQEQQQFEATDQQAKAERQERIQEEARHAGQAEPSMEYTIATSNAQARMEHEARVRAEQARARTQQLGQTAMRSDRERIEHERTSLYTALDQVTNPQERQRIADELAQLDLQEQTLNLEAGVTTQQLETAHATQPATPPRPVVQPAPAPRPVVTLVQPVPAAVTTQLQTAVNSIKIRNGAVRVTPELQVNPSLVSLCREHRLLDENQLRSVDGALRGFNAQGAQAKQTHGATLRDLLTTALANAQARR